MRKLAIGAVLAAASTAGAARGQQAQPLDTVRVSVASRAGAAADAARSATVITRDQIRRTAARSIDDVLALALGVDVRARSVASADVALRGASSEGVVVLVDGVRVSDQQSGHFDLDLAVPLDDVERIEILRGTASALHGADAVGGVINIVTRSDATGLTSVDAGGGSFGTGSLEAAGGAHAGSTMLTAALDASKSDGHRPGTDYRVSQLRLGAARPLGGGTLRVDAGTGVRHFGAADFYGPYPAYEDTRATTGDVRWDGDLAPAWSLSVDASTRRHGDLFTLVRGDPAIYQNRHVSWQSGADATVRRAVSDALTIAAGIDGEDLRLRSARLGNRDLTRGGVFTEAMLGRAGGPVLDATVRAERSSVDGTQGAPSIAAALPVGDGATVRLSASRGYRAPTWTERYYVDPANVGNPDLRVERFWSGEAGAHLKLPARLSFDGDVFVRDARDLIDWAKPVSANDSTPWRTMNVDRATFRGVEAQLDAPALLGGAWSVRTTGLRVAAASADGLRGKYALSPITRSFGVSATYPWKSLRASIDATTAERAGADAERTMNARLAAPVPGERDLELRVDLLNVTNTSYRDVSGAPVAGRAVYVAVRWTGH